MTTSTPTTTSIPAMSTTFAIIPEVTPIRLSLSRVEESYSRVLIYGVHPVTPRPPPPTQARTSYQ